jgi:hypothetical protein
VKAFLAKLSAAAHVVGNFNARLLLTLFYFIFVTPIGIVIRLFGDPLRIKRRGDTNWTPRSPRKVSLEEAHAQG